MSRTRARITAVLSGATLVLTAFAAPGSAATPAEPVGAEPGGQAVTATTTVTLITGDVVEYTPAKDGGVPSFDIREAPRPDGAPVTFTTLPDRDGGHLVMPSDAAGMIASGALDDELFDVETLAAEQRTETIPLIVTYAGDPAESAVAKAAAALPAAETTRTLDAVNGAAVTVRVAEAPKFWAALGDRPTLAGGMSKIWLDRRIEVSLDQSVPLIGAPTAWDRGFDGKGTKVAVLDTGIDAAHPDFAGRIVAGENFSDAPALADRSGHGTHVASTIAGSGSASDGKYKGVAPAASLLVGKVLNDAGNGDWSWAIAGMEWAAEQGADVVNLSLGSCCGDGTDPMSQAVDRLTEQHGTLFVVAAGNESDPLTVGIPAAADQALAVGAVDKTTGTTLAEFSSRGPRLDDAAVKPNIVAPGVDIVAARSADSAAKPIPGNDRYTANSGTSMATPHVSGAAALLAQQHPDWRAGELREALTSTAERNEAHNWFEQGSGRLDAGRAVTQTVFATSVVDFRLLDPAKGPVTRQVTYRNTGGEAVTLDVALHTRGWSGAAAPAEAIGLGSQTVTVPAGGTATVDLRVDPAAARTGAYGGWVTASGGDVRLTTPFSYYTGPDTHRLSFSMTNSYGTKEFYTSSQFGPLVYAIPMKRTNSPEDPFNPYAWYSFRLDLSGDGELYLPGGDWEIVGIASEYYPRTRNSWVIKEVSLDKDQKVALDARETVPLRPITPQATDGSGHVRYTRTFTDRPSPVMVYGGTSDGGADHDLFITPVSKVKSGKMRLSHQWSLERAVLDRATAGRLDLHPTYDRVSMSKMLTGPVSYPVVWAGQGRAEDFENLDVTGQLVLTGVPVGSGASPYLDAAKQMDTAARFAGQRGAAGFVGYFDVDGAGPRVPGGAYTTHRLGLNVTEGRALRAAVESGNGLSIKLEPYTGRETVYRLRFEERGRVPAKPERLDNRELIRIESDYHADQPETSGWEFGQSTAGDASTSLSYGEAMKLPLSRTEYFGPASGEVVWSREISSQGLDLFAHDRFPRSRARLDESWFKAPLVPGAADVPDGYPAQVPCVLCRDGDRFVPAEYWLDSDPRHYSRLSPLKADPRLTAGDAVITPQGRRPRSFIVPDGSAAYRLDAVDTSDRKLSEQVTTSSRFTSTPPTGTPGGYSCTFGPACSFQPAIQVTYDVPLDLLNRAPAGRAFTFGLRAGAHSSIRRAPDVREVEVEYSVDDGATWRDARRVWKHGHDGYRVTVDHPPLGATSGYVSLRVHASDKKGGSTTQTVKRAYALR
ncbi:S8 family serine peptidase [Streptosporangium soli]|nr:S8 family serine peptidase [Streptosporangium sp. KLBMP 9127]